MARFRSQRTLKRYDFQMMEFYFHVSLLLLYLFSNVISFFMQLPDYHEVIEHPMDFATIRKKLASSAYANLEQFEVDLRYCHFTFCLLSSIIFDYFRVLLIMVSSVNWILNQSFNSAKITKK